MSTTMSESPNPVFDDLKAQARGDSGSGYPEFSEHEAEQSTDAAEPETTPATDTADEVGAPDSPEPDAPTDYEAFLERLRAAEKARDTQAGKNGALMQENAELARRLEALEKRSAEAPATQDHPASTGPLRARDEDVIAFARSIEGDRFDEVWEDSYQRDMYRTGYNMALNVADGFGRELQTVKAELADMRFDRELADSGMDRNTFNNLIAELPQLQGMEQRDQLATIVRLGRSFGSGGQPSPAQGAPTTQRPRIETPMGGGSAMDPRARSVPDMNAVHDTGDQRQVRKAAASLMDVWKRENGLA